MVSRPKLHLPGKLRRKKALQSPEANTEQHPQASPFQTAAQPGSEPLGRIRVQVYGGQDLLAVRCFLSAPLSEWLELIR